MIIGLSDEQSHVNQAILDYVLSDEFWLTICSQGLPGGIDFGTGLPSEFVLSGERAVKTHTTESDG